MFFEALGLVLQRSAASLRDEVRPAVGEEFARARLDAVALMVGEIGAAWPGLFAALESENRLLEEALAAAGSRNGAEDNAADSPARDVAAPASDSDGAEADPLARNIELLQRVDRAVGSLHESGDDAALIELRQCLRRAATVEQELLAEAAERSGVSGVRRV